MASACIYIYAGHTPIHTCTHSWDAAAAFRQSHIPKAFGKQDPDVALCQVAHTLLGFAACAPPLLIASPLLSNSPRLRYYDRVSRPFIIWLEHVFLYGITLSEACTSLCLGHVWLIIHSTEREARRVKMCPLLPPPPQSVSRSQCYAAAVSCRLLCSQFPRH